jgi:succinoglycan biosynthesis protein ExoW
MINSFGQQRFAVIIPHYQKKPGLLAKALTSAFSQTLSESIHIYIVDDESPVSAQSEVDSNSHFPRDQMTIIRKTNGGAGSARNKALDLVPLDTAYAAFLDSDDEWQPKHLEHALAVLSTGADAYFADWWSYNYPEQTNFQRIGALKPGLHKEISIDPGGYDLQVTPIEHILKDGGGVIQTSTVVYRFRKFHKLRFREEFYNGQDFFFWMDLGQLGARFVFSTEVDCHNGEGINIYQSAGWGTERSLNRLRNELFVWTSVRDIYKLTRDQKTNNLRTIRNLESGVVRDVLHRLRHRKPVSPKLLLDVVRYDPSFLIFAPFVPIKILLEKFTSS